MTSWAPSAVAFGATVAVCRGHHQLSGASVADESISDWQTVMALARVGSSRE